MISILQPLIPHYRSEFFKKLGKSTQFKLFTYEDSATLDKQKLENSHIKSEHIWNIKLGPFLIYSPFVFLQSKQLVLMLHIGHLTTWLLLLTKFIHKKEIILWGHGISVKRYLAEEKNPSLLMKLMIKLSDKIWLYTDKEKRIWKDIFPDKLIVSLNNTIDGLGDIPLNKKFNKDEIKVKHNIRHEKCFIFCARFETPYRRVDLLIQLITKYQKSYGFIIIGAGKFKPDFSSFDNVYDYGSLYDKGIKNELFFVADMYIQPAWVGLSIVEAMAHGLPVFTFKRSANVLQCVEYEYLIDRYNSMIFDDFDDFVDRFSSLSNDDIVVMGENARDYVQKNLTMKVMVENAQHSFNKTK